MLRAATFLILLAASTTSLPVQAQERVRTPDGRHVLAVPEPPFVTTDTVVVARFASLEHLVEKATSLMSGLAAGLSTDLVSDEIEQFLLSKPGFPGIHRHRPVFLGIYAPRTVDTPMDISDLDDMLGVMTFSVVAIPVTNEVLFRGTLGAHKNVRFVERRPDGIFHFVREQHSFDYAGFSIALEKGDVDPNGDLSAFNRIEKSDILYRAVDNYVLMTTDPRIAMDLSKAPTSNPWSLVGEAPETTPAVTNVPVVDVREKGMFFSHADDFAISVDLPHVLEIYHDEVYGVLDSYKDILASGGGSTLGNPGDPAPEIPVRSKEEQLFVGIFDLYAEFVTDLLEGLNRVEFSLAEYRGGMIARMTLQPKKGSSLEPWLISSPSDSASNLISILPPDATMAFGMNYALDEELFDSWSGLIRRMAEIPGLDLDTADVDAYMEAVAEQMRNYTGRFAFSLSMAPDNGFSEVVVAELKDPAGPMVDITEWMSPGGMLEDMIGNLESLGIEIKNQPEMVRDGTMIRSVRVKYNKPEGSTGGTIIAPDFGALFGTFLDGLQITSCVRGNHLVLVTARDPLPVIDKVFVRMKEHNDVGLTMQRAIAPFARDGRMTGYIDIMRMMSFGLAAQPSGQSIDNATMDVMSNIFSKGASAAVGIDERTQDDCSTTSIHVSKDVILTFRKMVGELEEVGNVQMTATHQDVLEGGLGAFRAAHGRFPSTTEGLGILFVDHDGKPAACMEAFRPYTMDAWGIPFIYELDDKAGANLISHGRDGIPGGEGLDADIRRRLE